MLNIERLHGYDIPDTEASLTRRDAILYALGVGLGDEPTDPGQLQFLRLPDLRALPTMATILATPYAWIRRANVGWGGRSVHAGIHLELHREVPVEGSFVSRNTLDEVLDKGPGKAAIVSIRRKVLVAGTDEPVCTIRNTNMYLGDGGFGGPSQPAAPPVTTPERSPDDEFDMPTFPQQALLYQLNGDHNPLHNDPASARAQGFKRPILHGLATFGISGHAILKRMCGYEPARLRSIGGRFTRPVYPGEGLRVKMWLEGRRVLFQTSVPKRGDVVVLDRGIAEIAGAA